MGRYYELNQKLAGAHKRIVNGVTPAGFQNSVRSHLPLTLTDESVVGLATGLGWQQSWLKMGPARTPPPPVPESGNIQAMMRAAASSNSNASNSNAAAVMHAPVLGAPRHEGMVDPPRPQPEPVALALINPVTVCCQMLSNLMSCDSCVLLDCSLVDST